MGLDFFAGFIVGGVCSLVAAFFYVFSQPKGEKPQKEVIKQTHHLTCLVKDGNVAATEFARYAFQIMGQYRKPYPDFSVKPGEYKSIINVEIEIIPQNKSNNLK